MPLDTRIALGGQSLQLESPLAQYGQLMSVVNAGAQNQLAQMQMSAAQRAMQEEEDVKNYLARSDVDLNTAEGQRGLLRLGKPGQAMLKSLAEQKKLQAEEDKTKYEFEVKTLDRAINELTNLTDLPSAFAGIDRQIANKSITPQQGAELKTRINNAPDFLTWQNQTITGMLDAKERLGAMAEQRYQDFRGRPVAAPTAPAAAAAPMAAAGTPAQPDMANALALRIQGLEAQRNQLEPFLKSSSAKAKYDSLGKEIDNLSQGFSISAGGARYQPGVGMIERPFQSRLLTKEEEDQKARIAKAGATSVSVGAGQKAEDIELGKLVVDQYKEVSARADVATRSLPALDINLKTLDKGFDTGFGTETIAAGAKVLAALGVQNAKDFATDAQTFLANANSAVLQKQLEQKGVQTAADADRITSTGAQLGNTKEANKFILSVAKAQLQRDVAQRKFYSDWRTENKTFRGAEDAWYAGPGGASLFDSPILKKYAEPVAGQAENRTKKLDEIFKKAP